MGVWRIYRCENQVIYNLKSDSIYEEKKFVHRSFIMLGRMYVRTDSGVAYEGGSESYDEVGGRLADKGL